MAEDQAEKTEPATDKRREDTRRKGQVAQSREVQTVVVLGAALALLGSGFAVDLLRGLVLVCNEAWSSVHLRSLGDFHAVLLQSLAVVGGVLVPIMLMLALSGAGAALLQTGPMFSLEALKPKANRLSPAQGLKRLVDLDRLFDLGKALFKVSVVISIAWIAIRSDLDRIIAASALSLGQTLRFGAELALSVGVASLAFLAAMAALDLIYQRARHEKRIRMSKKEVRDESKEREGNPHVKARARSLQREMSRSRMIAAVADASVVVTNPTHYAVALQYGPELTAPKVLAKGRNHVAKRIRELARENDVPIVENKPLAQLLHKSVKVGQDVPEALYQAVAEVLAYVYRLRPDKARSWSPAS